MTLQELEAALTALYVEANEFEPRRRQVALPRYRVVMEAQGDEVRGVWVDHDAQIVYLDNKAH
jgi:hypothetical protein